MQQIAELEMKQNSNTPIQTAAEIPPLTHEEAGEMAQVEFNRFLDTVAGLGQDDWARPTACSLWSVKDIVAHISGALAGFASWRQFFRQNVTNPYVRRAATPIDGINQRQVEDRADHSPAQLLAELRQVGPKALRTRHKLPAALREFRPNLPAPFSGPTPIGYLTDVIYTRDMWMHRLDLSRATGHPFVQDRAHDGRIVALVMRDLSQNLAATLAGKSVVIDLNGPAGGRFHMGIDLVPAAVISMDVIDFNLLASGRLATTQISAQGMAQVSGDCGLAELVLANTSVAY